MNNFLYEYVKPFIAKGSKLFEGEERATYTKVRPQRACPILNVTHHAKRDLIGTPI